VKWNIDRPTTPSTYLIYYHLRHNTLCQLLTNMATHSAVATVGIKAPLAIIEVPTITPIGQQVRIRVEWTASTPLDLHQNDGGLLVKHPQVLGDSAAGTVVEVGPAVLRLKVGDKVFGFTWRSQAEKAQQEFCTADEWQLAKVFSL
jgi:NADPH:quinone reductase-like Zn-dependent oxidoreductase